MRVNRDPLICLECGYDPIAAQREVDDYKDQISKIKSALIDILKLALIDHGNSLNPRWLYAIDLAQKALCVAGRGGLR